MKNIQGIFSRLNNSAVVWSWAFNGFRLASGLFLLPLLLRKLPIEDLGIYYIFLRLIALTPIIDFGFSVSIGRYVSYAMGGATELKAQGIVPSEGHLPPNFALLGRLSLSYQHLYRYLALATLVVLGICGTYNVGLNVLESSSPHLTWIAWGVTLLAATLEIYFGWWSAFLRGMNQVVLPAQLAVMGYALQLILAAGLLLWGYGLLSLPIASLVGTMSQRFLARRHCLKLLGNHALAPQEPGEPSLLRLLWPNTWRVGLQFLSAYLGTAVPTLIFAGLSGSAAFAPYGVSLQIMGICAGMASVWTAVKWALVGQYRTRQDFAALRRMLWPRIWLQSATFVLLAGFAVIAGPVVLHWLSPDKELLPANWLFLLALTAFLELQFSFWTTLLSTENRIPSVWPTVVTNIVALLLFVVLIQATSLGFRALVLSPFLAGCLFSYWYWPLAGARNLQTRWFRFTFSRPA